MAQFNTTELDFDQIKTNLKNHFQRTGSAFADWDFEGSGLSSLLDVLAYNTHYNAVNAHMAMNESFLDSAQLRANVVSRAKLLGYTPRSATGAVATINVTFTRQSNSTSAEYTLPRGSRFTTTIDNVTYTFQTIEDKTVSVSSSGKFIFNGLDIYQGTRRTIEYAVDDSSYQKFTINFAKADTSTLKIQVLNGPDDVSPETYTKFQTFTNIDSNSQIYFLNENGDGYYDITFGDGIIGKSPNPLDIIQIDFLTTDGEIANGAKVFSYASGANAIIQDNASIVLVTKAQGGGEKESIDSVKFNAPLTFISQNRAITAEDYKTIIQQSINNVKDVSVWGGEDNDIPNYGEVNISVRPLDINQLTLTDAEKKEVEAFLVDRKVVSIKPVLRDPQYTFLFFQAFFKFNLSLTTKTKDELVTDVRSTISQFNENNLNNFDSVFRYSNFLRVIDLTNTAITNSVVRVFAYKNLTITVTGNVSANDSIDFGFALDGKSDQTESMISSTTWTYSGSSVQLGDEKIAGQNKRRIYVFTVKSDGSILKVVTNAGSLDPSTGKITLNNLPASATSTIKVKVRPASDDVVAKRKEVLSIDLADTSVTGDIDSSISGVSRLLSDYETVNRD
jgi:hypothetical protein